MISSIPVFDADSHIAEVPDLWTSRLPMSKWGDDVPHVVYDERLKRDRWVIGGRMLTSVANWAVAGWNEFPPEHPPTVDDADPGAFEPGPRLQRMDEYGIYCQALYPNLLAFSHHAFMEIKDPKLQIACIQAYNDHLVDFASVDPKRFVLLAALPFWNVEESVKEIERCAEIGHHGILFIAKPHKMGLPRISDEHWTPIFDATQDKDWSVNFHTGFADFSETEFKSMLSRHADRRDYARLSAFAYLNNAEAIAEVVMSGLCKRYPGLKFVSVESGFGWVPAFVESMDWQWLNSGASQAYPRLRAAQRVLQTADLRDVLVRARVRPPDHGPVSGQPHVRDRLPAPDQFVTRAGLGRPVPARDRGRRVRGHPRGHHPESVVGKRGQALSPRDPRPGMSHLRAGGREGAARLAIAAGPARRRAA